MVITASADYYISYYLRHKRADRVVEKSVGIKTFCAIETISAILQFRFIGFDLG